jgi:Na+/H+ antiporter NhaD/arsenite permease-like protein
MGLLSAVTLIVDIFIMAAMLEVVLDIIRPARVMRTDHQRPQDARRSRRLLRISLMAFLIVACAALWASWHFVFARLFR